MTQSDERNLQHKGVCHTGNLWVPKTKQKRRKQKQKKVMWEGRETETVTHPEQRVDASFCRSSGGKEKKQRITQKSFCGKRGEKTGEGA